jgi:hypothetical protein
MVRGFTALGEVAWLCIAPCRGELGRHPHVFTESNLLFFV